MFCGDSIIKVSLPGLRVKKPKGRILITKIKNMSTILKVAIWIVIIIIIIGGIWWAYMALQPQAYTANNNQPPVTQTNVAPDTSDTALSSVLSAIDTQINGLSSDTASVDQSFTQ
jgi:cytoskeletal protein RodZ